MTHAPRRERRTLMDTLQRPADHVRVRDGFIGLAYFALYLAYLFWHQENEIAHWVTMVLLPFVVGYLALSARRRSVATALASLGIARGSLKYGVAWALLAGAAITLFQIFLGGNGSEIRELIRSGRAFWLFPLTFLLMLILAGSTEEVFFRGFLQTRMEKMLRSRWAAMLLVAFLFGIYHLPYAYYNPHWPSHGDWGLAWKLALANGLTGGAVLGTFYIISRGNLVACIVLHALINAAPAMTMVRIGGN